MNAMNKRKIICSILIIFIVGNNICINAVQENSNKTLEELQEESENINSQIMQNAQKLEIVEEELSQAIIQIQEIDNKILSSEEELNKINDEVEKLNTEILKKEEELKIKRIEYEKINKKAEQILVVMYENGNIQYLDVLLSSKSIIEFISNYYLISELVKYNIELLEEAVRQKEDVENTMQQLENQKEENLLKKKEQQRVSQILENTKTSKQYYVEKLTGEEKQIQQDIEQYRAQMITIEREIRNLSGIKNFGEEYIGEDMIWPIPGKKNITSKYGARIHPITGVYDFHKGVDVSAIIGTNFVAMASGVVTKAEYNKYYGNMVIIDHGGGVQTLYAHGSEIIVKLGDLVAQGETVLKVGSTGYSTGPHAHFEIRIDGNNVNPLDYVEPK